MNETIAFLVLHGELVLFVVVLAEQAGLPLPSALFLIAAGALVGTGRLEPVRVIGLSFAASLLADLIWFEIGRRYGMRVLGLMCRISFEPDSCVRATESMFMRHGLRALLVAKFIPGFGTMAPPLVGVFRLGVVRFLIYDSIGSLLWVVAFVAAGYAFSDQLELVARQAGRIGMTVGTTVGGVLVLYFVSKVARRWLVLRRLGMGRITVEELQRRLLEPDPPLVVDLRHALDLEVHPYVIPSALRMAPEEILDRHVEIPPEREVVLYCS